MSIETTHVRLRLIDPKKEIFNPETGITVSGADVIKQMKINNVWRNDKHGRYAAVQYAGQTFKFKEDTVLTVPASLAPALRANSAICVGSDKLNGPIIPFLEVAETFELTESSIHNDKGRIATVRSKLVRGVVISSATLTVPDWLGEVRAEVQTLAGQSVSASDVLHDFL